MILYKYNSVKHAVSILKDSRLKISPPNEFNDPFEVTHRPRKTTKAEWEKLKSLWEQIPNKKEKNVPETFKEAKRFLIAKPIKDANDSIEQASKEIGILSLSKPNDSIPMWAYYAESHRGVAFGFEALHPSFEEGHAPVFDAVQYQKNRFLYDPFLLSSAVPSIKHLWFKQLWAIMTTKSSVWKHEKEYRRIYQLKNPNLVKEEKTVNDMTGEKKMFFFLKFQPEAIREVVFGRWVDNGLEAEIRAEIESKKPALDHVCLFRCVSHPRKFKLDIVLA